MYVHNIQICSRIQQYWTEPYKSQQVEIMVVKNCTPAAKKQATGTAAKVITPAKKEKRCFFLPWWENEQNLFFKRNCQIGAKVADNNLILVLTVTVQASNNNPFLRMGSYIYSLPLQVENTVNYQLLPYYVQDKTLMKLSL